MFNPTDRRADIAAIAACAGVRACPVKQGCGFDH